MELSVNITNALKAFLFNVFLNVLTISVTKLILCIFFLQELEIFNKLKNTDKNYSFIMFFYFFDVYLDFKDNHDCNLIDVNKICYTKVP